MLKDKFKIIKDSRGHIVIRIDGPYTAHAHVKTMNTCRMLIKLIESNRMPNSDYLKVSCQRLLSEDEYKMLKSDKQRYVNGR